METKVIWPGWEIVRKLGSGSFGDVYEIQRNIFGLSESAALKVISIPKNNDEIDDLRAQGYKDMDITKHYERCLEQIIQEYSLMAQIRGHANVVNCEDVQVAHQEDGIGWNIYIKMELLHPLMKSLDRVTTEAQVVKLGQDICSALVRCKERGIIHRDIKPQNIFISDDGNFKLGDFGIAKTVERTTGGTRIGTYKYMAPEVYNNHPYGAAADVYSLGLVLYWLLNERRTPFLPLPPQIPTPTDEEHAGLRRFRGEAIPEPKYGSPELKRIVLKACAYASIDRYNSAAEMLDDLQKLKNISSVSLPVMPAAQSINGAQRLSVPQQGTVVLGYTGGTVPMQPQVQPAPVQNQKPKKKAAEVIWLIFGIVFIIGGLILTMGIVSSNENKNSNPKESQSTEMATNGATTQHTTTAPFYPTDDNPLGLLYDVNEDGRTCTLTGKGDFSDAVLSIPSYVDGYQVTAIGDSAFKECQITTLNISNTITAIYGHAFADCTALSAIYIPGNVEYIGQYAFTNCTAATLLTISEGVDSIDEFAFYGCKGLTSVKIPKSMTNLGDDAFVGCYQLTTIQVDSENPYFTTVDGVVYNKSMTRLCYFPAGKTGEFRVPDGITGLGDYTFFKCSGITSVVLPDSVTSIGYRTFYKCSNMTSINIPNAVTEISQYAFSGCEALTSVTVPDGVTTINEFAFYECKNMQTISLPAGITSIGRSGISRCENLIGIYFAGTMDQWNAVEKGQNWKAYTGKYTVYCIDGSVEKQ